MLHKTKLSDNADAQGERPPVPPLPMEIASCSSCLTSSSLLLTLLSFVSIRALKPVIRIVVVLPFEDSMNFKPANHVSVSPAGRAVSSRLTTCARANLSPSLPRAVRLREREKSCASGDAGRLRGGSWGEGEAGSKGEGGAHEGSERPGG